MNDSEEKVKAKYFNLSPLTNIEAPVYFEALNEKLNDDSIKNIAIIGPYGSGKSSVIDSYILTDRKNNYLRVSLANFCESTNKFIEEDEKKIEEQILQQLFYQLPYDDIPYSGFKKINHIDKRDQQKLVIAIIVWIFSIALIPRLFKHLNDNLESISRIGIMGLINQIVWFSSVLNIMILTVFCIGLFHVLKEIMCIKRKGQLKKITMKTAQVELSEDSALNKYIDELIYFFEATEKNIVIIEDLDRFNNILLFSKLREVNFLINNSPKVSQRVKFVYAIKDDIFNNNFNRTKFFDYILPIVPVINITNSGDKLRKMLTEKNNIAQNYINEISLYIHDMRLLKNIVNEYNIYNDIINKDNNKSRIFLFSQILYKNLFPKEFSDEHTGGGLLYKIFKEKKATIIKELTKDKIEKQAYLESQKKEILSETAQSEIKLREEYILEIQKTHADIKSICDNSVLDMLTEENFNKLFANPKIEKYYLYQQNYQAYNYRINQIDLDFDVIENKINPNKTYQDRLELIKKRKTGIQLKIELEIVKNKQEIEKLHRKKLYELIKQYKDNSWEAIILDLTDQIKLSQEEKLLMLLLRKGYIEENYFLYISYFYEGVLSLKDFEFLLNVKNNEEENFETNLSNVNEIISRISDDEYEYPAALNRDIIRNLLSRFGYNNDNRIEFLFQQFEQNEEAFEEYILPLINHLQSSQKELQRFIELLVTRYYPTIWKNIEIMEDEKKDELLKQFMFLSEENFKSMNIATGDDSLKNYLTSKSDFIDIFFSPSEVENVTKLIKALNLKFNKLTFNLYNGNEIFNYIYQNDHYELNKDMLYLMLFHKNNISQDKFNELFHTQNYTCICTNSKDVLNEYILSNFSIYIKNIYLQLDNKQKESEDSIYSIIELLDEENNTEILSAVLQKISTQIIDLKKFGKEDKWGLLFDCTCVDPNWNNLINYFIKNEKEINDIITKWLSNEYVCKTLTQLALRFDDNNEEKNVIISLQIKIMENNKFSIQHYEWLIISFPYIFPKINLLELSIEKISKLIEYNKIVFNSQHYEQILHLELIDALSNFTINNLEKFLKNYQDYNFSLDLHKRLLSSKIVPFKNKQLLVAQIAVDNISDSEIAELVCEVLLKTINNTFEQEKIIHVIKKCNHLEIKLKMLNKFTFNFSEIDLLLESIGGVYKKASVLRKRPNWENNELNRSVAKKLKDIGYFRNIEFNKNGEIKIVVRYS